MPRAFPGQAGPAYGGTNCCARAAYQGSLGRQCFFVAACAGVIIITGSEVAYMANVRSPIANLLMLPSRYDATQRNRFAEGVAN